MTEVMKLVAVDCLESETIAAYLDGRLSARERMRISEHLTVCAECYSLVVESGQTLVRIEPVESANAVSWRAWMIGSPCAKSTAAVLATAACLWLIVGTGNLPTLRRPNRALQAMVAAVGTDRPIEPRLSGGFAYGLIRGPVRSASMQSLSPDVRSAAAFSEKALAGAGTSEALHALGVADLITGDLARSVSMFERAVAQSGSDARMLSDLSAAYIVRAERNNQPQDLTKALAAVDRAVKLDPTLAEALFNRALALERLALEDEARVAWQDYLRIDDMSGWADEARAHSRALR